MFRYKLVFAHSFLNSTENITMNVLKGMFVLILFVLKIFNQVDGVCILNIKKDFPRSPVVYLHDGRYLAPNSKSGDILLRSSETLKAACPGDKKFLVLNNVTSDINILDIKCVTNKIFRASKLPWVGNFSEIKCNSPPWFTTEDAGKCSGQHTLHRVGYKISNKFYTLYETCFNGDLLNTLYVKEELGSESIYIQMGSRPNFLGLNFYGKIKMSKIYTLSYQKERFRQILGNGKEDEYITKKQFLTRGHLSPRADYPLLSSQRATFLYANAAPQWQRGNAGDWAALEEALRRRVHVYGRSVTVYTGTYGVLTLEDQSSRPQEMYLGVDGNNNGIVPIPLYYYKVVYDGANKTAVAFVSINSSYYNSTMIKKLSFCDDICEKNPKFSWLKWRSNDGTHSFCCEYEDFVTKIDNLPKLDVKGLFY